MLSITKNSEKGIDFNVPPPNEGDSYYIVAYLYKIGDSIQLIWLRYSNLQLFNYLLISDSIKNLNSKMNL